MDNEVVAIALTLFDDTAQFLGPMHGARLTLAALFEDLSGLENTCLKRNHDPCSALLESRFVTTARAMLSFCHKIDPRQRTAFARDGAFDF